MAQITKRKVEVKINVFATGCCLDNHPGCWVLCLIRETAVMISIDRKAIERVQKDDGHRANSC